MLAFLVYVIGVSLDKACAVLSFFCQLPLAKSQADALLRQLAHHWETEFDTLCAFIARAAVVYMDETGWKIGNEVVRLWTFTSAGQRGVPVRLSQGCGHPGRAHLLPPEVFHSIGIGDDAAVYPEPLRAERTC